MSAFEVNLTPTRYKKENFRQNENREPVVAVMAPFSGKSTIVFENVPITKCARRFLVISNPSDEELQVTLNRGFGSDLNITVDWQTNCILPRSEVKMEIVWNPLHVITATEKIQFIDNRNFRKDVFVVFKSIDKRACVKNVVRYPKLSSGTSKQQQNHPTIFKSASTTSLTMKKSSQPLSKISSSEMNISKTKATAIDLKPTDQCESPDIKSKTAVFSPSIPTIIVEKENISPETPKNGSDIFDKFKFTPVTETKTKQTSNLELLSSLPTPILRKSREHRQEVEENDLANCGLRSARLSDIFVSSSSTEKQTRPPTPRKTPQKWTPKIVPHKCITCSVERHHNTKQSPSEAVEQQTTPSLSLHSTPEKISRSTTPSPNIEMGRRKLFTSQAIAVNKTFELSEKSPESIESGEDLCQESSNEVGMNKTATLSTSKINCLSVIEEEENKQLEFSTATVTLQKTFAVVDEKLLRDVQLIGTPLRKPSESLKELSSKKHRAATQGSMPNLNEMEAIESIERNRYYRQPIVEDSSDSSVLDTSDRSAISTAEVFFDQHEILAQSSRFNIHEITKSTVRNIQKTPSAAKPNRTPRPENQSKRLREPSVDSPSNYLTVETIYHAASTLAVSPPKRAKLEATHSPRVYPATKFRVTKWGAMKPKKLKLIKRELLSPCRVKTVPLYNPEMHLLSFINPDPFAATTTFDPFLASTMYLDERAINKHEEQFKKWLNALVALPAELDIDIAQKIDVGQLFNQVRNRDLVLAPTKEEQSMNYLTKSKMDALRAAAVRLYMSPDMIEICSKVAVYIEKGGLEMRKDRDLHLDVVLQQRILELLLCFNPIWLRIGLEVVFGEIIHLHSNGDVIRLSHFILNRLFRDRNNEQQHRRAAYALSKDYAAYIRKFSLQKVLFLLLFLDKAKNGKIIKHNPCLFVKTSKYKETKEILQRFSSELLANVGDITRKLSRVTDKRYSLTHKQTFLDEFNYAFNNLAIDLRDGVRLTRVMEIILLRENLTSQLRVPAISRMQRIFNVNLGLKALAEANFTLSGDISAADIVDGHREKTLSLLWQIIYKFRSPKFHAAATVIQKWWRDSWLKVIINRRIRMKIELRRQMAATCIQAAFRAYLARQRTAVIRKTKTQATVCLQKYCRRYLAQRRFRMIQNCVLYIQRWYRTSKQRKIERMRYLELKSKTIKIQMWYRRIKFSRKLMLAAEVIKAIKVQARAEYEKAIVIQRACKSYMIRKKFLYVVQEATRRNQLEKLEYSSAVRIQSFFQMIRFRRKFQMLRTNTMKIQRYWRSSRLAKIQRIEYVSQRTAALKVQQHWRAHLARQKQREQYLRLRSSTMKIQRKYRATKLAKHARQSFLQLKESVVKIQRYWRSKQLAKRQRTEYIEQRTATIKIQQYWRAHLAMRKQLAHYLLLRSNTLKIQRKYRAIKLARLERHSFLRLKQSTVIIQHRLRATLLMRKQRIEFLNLQFAAIITQQRYRANRAMKIDQHNYYHLKVATVCIQRQYRAKVAMKSARDQFLRLKAATIRIQQKFRATLLMRKHRSEYLKIRSATIALQQHFRANRAMRSARDNYSKLKAAAIHLQRKYRATALTKSVRMSFLKLKIATIAFQRKFRAYQKRRNEKASIIQHWLRATLLTRKQRENYLKMRSATIAIQQRFRANRAMKIDRKRYSHLKAATVCLQHRYRARIAMKSARNEYLQLKLASIVIQRKFRACLKMRKEREKFIKLKSIAIAIQRNFRIRRAAARTIQNWYRRTKLQHFDRAEFLRNRSAAIRIQQWYRSITEMRIERSRFLELKRMAVVIQQTYRARQLGRIDRKNFIGTKTAIFNLQKYARGMLARRRFTEMLTPERREEIRRRKATRVIQRYWRGYLVRKRLHSKKLAIMRNRIKEANQNAKSQDNVKNRIVGCVEFLKRRYSLTDLLAKLIRLENLSRVIPYIFQEHATFIASFCYGIMAQAIRSEPDKQIIELCSRVILNLARYPTTTEHVFQEQGLVTIAQMLLRWCDKDCSIFNTLCTLVWVFIKCNYKRKIIRNYMNTEDAKYMLRETKRLVLRKEKMRLCSRKPSQLQQHSNSSQLSRRCYPHLNPDFDVVKTNPYVFICPVFAFDVILSDLEINI